VDIPLTQVASAVYLGLVLGEDKISLNGENHMEAIVNFMTPRRLLESSDVSFAISLNCDSFTEMDRKVANQYADFCLKKTDLLISVNHEINHFKVIDLESLEGCNLSREPYWVRPGYVKELYSSKINFG
jgi:hypothetical protein